MTSAAHKSDPQDNFAALRDFGQVHSTFPREDSSARIFSFAAETQKEVFDASDVAKIAVMSLDQVLEQAKHKIAEAVGEKTGEPQAQKHSGINFFKHISDWKVLLKIEHQLNVVHTLHQNHCAPCMQRESLGHLISHFGSGLCGITCCEFFARFYSFSAPCEVYHVGTCIAANGDVDLKTEPNGSENPSYNSVPEDDAAHEEARVKRQAEAEQNETATEPATDTTALPTTPTPSGGGDDHDHKSGFGSFVFLALTSMSTVGELNNFKEIKTAAKLAKHHTTCICRCQNFSKRHFTP